MKQRGTVTLLLGLLLLCPIAYAQTSGDVKQFNKDGLLFEYEPDWSLSDDSNSDAQQLTFTRGDSDAQIRVFVHRRKIPPEKMAKARKSLVDSYIESTTKQFIFDGSET